MLKTPYRQVVALGLVLLAGLGLLGFWILRSPVADPGGHAVPSGRTDSAASPLIGVSVGFGQLHLALIVTGLAVAAATTVCLQIAGVEPWWWTVLLSVLPVLLLSAFWVWSFLALAKPQGVNANEYQQVVDRLSRLQAVLADLGPDLRGEAGSALKEACTNAERLVTDLGATGSRWLSGHAYLDAWERLHRAEEAVVICGPRTSVRAVAIENIDRLIGSKIDQASRLRARAEKAAEVLMDEKRLFEWRLRQSSEAAARQDVRYVRNAINRYREDNWRALVDFRDTVMSTTALLWVFLYAALLVALAAGASPKQVVTGAMYFMLGVLVGLVSQIYSQSRTDPSAAVEDFGLSVARMLAVPAFAGAMGLLGVVILAALHASVNGVALSPVGTDAPGVDWSMVFDWRANGVGFGVAAVVALAPERLFDLLKNTKQIKLGISSSEATGAA